MPLAHMSYTHRSHANLFAPVIAAVLLVAVPVATLAQDARHDRVPYAGADLAYDYKTGEYYRYEGPRQQDPRTREQTGYRDGTLHTRPNAGYYAGVTWIGGYRHHQGCGCSAYYGHRRSDYYDGAYDQSSGYSNGYFERYASSNSNRWGYKDRRYWGY